MQRVNLALAAVVVVVAVVIALVLAAKSYQSGAGLDAGWGAFLALVFGFVLRAAWGKGGRDDGGDDEA